MRKVNIYPSIMCAKPWEFRQFIEEFEKGGIEAIHFDVMDGHFVPNMTLGVGDFNAIKEISKLPVDAHFMVNEPEKFLEYFKFEEGDTFSFHPETSEDPIALLKTLREKGIRAGYAISPDTSTKYVEDALEYLDMVIVLAVYPGFAGQKMLPTHLDKLQSIRDICDKADHKIEIIVDGNTTAENTKKMIENGADGVVAGTSSLLKYGPETFDKYYHDYMEAIK